MHATLPLLETTEFPVLNRGKLETLQVNLGYRCNQSCVHCHVNAGPNRKEMMDQQTLELIPQVLMKRHIANLDLTGGAPEMHDQFRWLVKQACDMGVHVIDRCNLTILYEPGQSDLAEFMASNRVEVVASLPCYSQLNVDKQRGNGVFKKSIAALKKLNQLGYGKSGSGLLLNLVYNPQGPVLPPNQASLEATYKDRLREDFAIEFNHLFTVTNMPIKRFGSSLISKGQFHSYMQLLKDNYSSSNLHNLMCRSLLSVDWQGFLYDCDFNQQLGIPLSGSSRVHLRTLLGDDVEGREINVADHCFACTAGQGSSCGGAL